MHPQDGSTNDSMEVLIVEDSPTQALLLKRSLERRGHRVSVARSGAEALSALRGQRPSIVVSGIVMPGMDGHELCRQIKADPNLKEIPVALLTWLADHDDLFKGLECGADGLIVKPCSEESLISRLQSILVKREIRRRAAPEVGIELFIAGGKL